MSTVGAKQNLEIDSTRSPKPKQMKCNKKNILTNLVRELKNSMLFPIMADERPDMKVR